MSKKKPLPACPHCQAPIENPADSLCRFCWEDLPRPKTDALDRFPRSQDAVADPDLRDRIVSGRTVEELRRRVHRRTVWTDQHTAQEELVEERLLIRRRETVRFLIHVYPKHGVTAGRAELRSRLAITNRDPYCMGAIWQPVKSVPLDRIVELEDEVVRLNGGRPLEPWDIHRVVMSVERRGRPKLSRNTWEQDQAAYAAGTLTREEIRVKYSQGRRCPQCRAFLPDAWTKAYCSSTCKQEAYRSRRRRGGN